MILTVVTWIVVALAILGVALVLFTAWMARGAVRALPPRGKFVDVGDARLHYLEFGSGATTLLLIHGLGGQAGNFTYALVSRLAPEFHVVVVERPGSGYSTWKSGRSPASTGPRAHAAVIAAFIRALGLGRPVVVGHSLGGAIALATALDYPALVSALALVAPLTQPLETPPPGFEGLQLRWPWLRRLVGWTLATPLTLIGRDRVLRDIFGPDAVPEDYATAGGALLTLRPSAFVASSSDMVSVVDDMPALARRYETLKIPVGILFGRGDRILDPHLHGEGMIGHVRDLHLEWAAGGHMLPLTAPDRVAQFIREIAALASAPSKRSTA